MNQRSYRVADVDGLNVFYREAGRGDEPPVLLHGFPTAGHMFRDLIPQLAGRFHVIAPDLPSYGLTGRSGSSTSRPRSSIRSCRCSG